MSCPTFLHSPLEISKSGRNSSAGCWAGCHGNRQCWKQGPFLSMRSCHTESLHFFLPAANSFSWSPLGLGPPHRGQRLGRCCSGTGHRTVPCARSSCTLNVGLSVTSVWQWVEHRIPSGELWQWSEHQLCPGVVAQPHRAAVTQLQKLTPSALCASCAYPAPQTPLLASKSLCFRNTVTWC